MALYDRTWQTGAEGCWLSELVSYKEPPLSQLAPSPGPSLWPQSGLGLGLACPWSCQTSTTSPRSITASLIHSTQQPFAKSITPLLRHTAVTVSIAVSLNPERSLPPSVTFFFKAQSVCFHWSLSIPPHGVCHT